MKTAIELEKDILFHDHQYWVLNDPIISDTAYDELCRQLRELDPDNHVLHQVHGVGVDKGATVERDKPMLSLDKAYTGEEVLKWARSVARDDTEKFRIAPKFDGLACELDGEIMATSGDDGYTGEDISDKLVITDFSRIEGEAQAYGELVIFKQDLHSLKRKGGQPYKTTRAAAVGLVNSDSTDRSIGRVLKFMPHDICLATIELQDFEHTDWQAWMDEVQGREYPTDGLVIALEDTEYGETLGATDHHPRHSIALKYKNPSAITKLVGVEWQCGKRKITPVAILEPVEISGCTHDKASLHNVDQMHKLNLEIGSEVIVERCGDVIPQIAGVTGEKEFVFPINVPEACPACDHPTKLESPDLVCTNPTCGGAAAKKLLDALTRLGVESIGPGIISQLIGKSITTVPQVFEMTVGDWRDLDGFAGPSAMKMYKRLERIRLAPIEDYKILGAMNIQGVGLSMAKRICAAYSLSVVPVAALNELEGIGEARAQAIKTEFDFNIFYWATTNLELVQTKGLAERPLVCFTGKSERGRADWVQMAEKAGYTFHKTVTKKLSVLVCSDTSSTSSKMKKARKYETKIITYDQFETEITNAPDT